MQLKCIKKVWIAYGEGAGTEQTCWKRFVKFRAGDFSLDNAPRSGRPVEVDSGQMRHWEQSMLYHMGDSWHTQNIQINTVTGENENMSFILWGKNPPHELFG